MPSNFRSLRNPVLIIPSMENGRLGRASKGSAPRPGRLCKNSGSDDFVNKKLSLVGVFFLGQANFVLQTMKEYALTCPTRADHFKESM